MLILLAVLNNLISPYWNTFKKSLSKEGFASLTIIHSPNLFGHLLGIGALLLLGLFAIPHDNHFFLFWFGMIFIASIQLKFNIWGLVRSNFFGVHIISNLGFVASSISAVLFIGEHLTGIQYFAIGIAVLGVMLFAWPRSKVNLSKLDIGIVFVVISVILSGLSSVMYKIATFYTPNYTTFLTGRFVADLVGWTLVWLASLLFMNRNPFKEISQIIHNKSGQIMIAGFAASNLLGSWLVYVLPVSKLAILGTLSIPASYFISRAKYQELMTNRMWIGTICIIFSIIIFLLKI